MNDFTKDELHYLLVIVDAFFGNIKLPRKHWPEMAENIFSKIIFKMDSYCEHKNTEINSYVGSKCLDCGRNCLPLSEQLTDEVMGSLKVIFDKK